MAFTVNKKQTFAREITDPETGEKATIQIRRLTEGDRQDREGLSISMRIEQRKGKKRRKNQADTDFDYVPGRVRLFEIERGLVSWDIPHPANPSATLPLNTGTIKTLEPWAANQIHDYIVELNPYFFQEDEDEEDEDEESDADEDFDEASEAIHREEDGDDEADGTDPASVEQIFGETDGPKEITATS